MEENTCENDKIHRYYKFTMFVITYLLMLSMCLVLNNGNISLCLRIIRLVLLLYVLFILIRRKENIYQYTHTLRIVLFVEKFANIFDRKLEKFNMTRLFYNSLQCSCLNFIFSVNLETSVIFSMAVTLATVSMFEFNECNIFERTVF
jgi:hypothetical protein